MADFVKCPPQPKRMLSRQLLAFCAKHRDDLEAQLLLLRPDMRPPRKTMRSVAERLELQNQDASGAVLRRLKDVWWDSPWGRRSATSGEESFAVVTELQDGHLHVRIPVDVFFGVIAGDMLRVKHGTDVVMVTRQEGK